MANVKVALRIRPLTAKEESCDQQSAVHVDANNTVHLSNHGISKLSSENEWDKTNNSNPTRQFSFDYCFGAPDGSDPVANVGSQEMVFEELGTQVLDALFEGYNACVLAYGQSGTGKTYTMMGTASEPGLAPRLCKAIFERMPPRTIEDNSNDSSLKNPRPSFRVDVSFMEIYNEKVRDLLDQKSSSVRNGVQLKVREHPKSGPYVQNLSRHVVNDAACALQLLSEGIQRRNSAATHINGHSSRSHAVFTLHCTAAWIVSDGLPRETVAKLHLVDLAGSERANHDNVNRLRLKEGSLINKSLASLGNVINALAEKAANFDCINASLNSNSSFNSSPPSTQTTPSGSPRRSRTPFIPYRDSVLTWILKDSLGGNSRTFIVAAISPAIRAFKETLSTLRFAQRAKKVVNQPIVNEDAGVKLIRHLKEEVSRLRGLLAQSIEASQLNYPGGIRSETIVELMTVNQSKVRELTEDWLHRWRSLEPGDAETTANNPPRSNDIGVQTSFPVLIKEDSVDLVPVNQSATLWLKDAVVSTQKMQTDSEAGVWSDDSLDSYKAEEWPKKTTSKCSSSGKMYKPTTEESNANVDQDSQSVGSYASLWTSEPCIQHAQQSPSCTIHGNGINVRNHNKTSPDVKTIFSYSRGFQEEKDATDSSTLVAASEELRPDRLPQVPIYHSDKSHSNFPVGKFPSSSSPIPHNLLPNSAIPDDLLTRLHITEWPSNCNIQCEPISRTNSFSTFNQTNYCSVSLHHCKVCHKQNHRSRHYCHCQHHLRCRSHHSVVDHLSPSFESVMRAELLAIRRRMVARTASPKVAQTLSYLRQSPNRIFSQSYQMYDTFNIDDDNLPGEIWV